MVAINQAHLVMLAETGILPAADAAAIARALSEIDTETDIAASPTPASTRTTSFSSRPSLARQLGDLGGALHTARSRNDMDHTLFKMALRAAAPRHAGTALHTLADALIAKARDRTRHR